MFSGAHNIRIDGGAVNNVGGDQVNHNINNIQNIHPSLPPRTLWDAIAGIGASHNSGLQFDRGRCLAGTREDVRRTIHEWRRSRSSDTPPICWLSGSAGVGKSAIALSVAKECENNGLVASFFFFRSDPNRNTPRFLILSIAHGIGTSRPYLRGLIDQRVATDPKILEAALEEQYRELIVNPCTKEK
ncbi:hypothetical protein L218DRAFT_1052073 [Marasmius fiardii PR-910]|nr:hypothetical protein L218DRAFT_1052073 [Marasmius fiardii PR-910]